MTLLEAWEKYNREKVYSFNDPSRTIERWIGDFIHGQSERIEREKRESVLYEVHKILTEISHKSYEIKSVQNLYYRVIDLYDIEKIKERYNARYKKE